MMKDEILKNQIIKKAWEDPSFKDQLLKNPREVLKREFNVEIPEGINLITLEETPKNFYLVVPPKPSKTINGLYNAASVWNYW